MNSLQGSLRIQSLISMIANVGKNCGKTLKWTKKAWVTLMGN